MQLVKSQAFIFGLFTEIQTNKYRKTNTTTSKQTNDQTKSQTNTKGLS